MNQYATYQFYTGGTFRGSLIGADEFDRYIVKASAFLDGITFGRITYVTEDISAAACAVAEQMHRIDVAYSSTDGGLVASEKTGDESKSYNTSLIIEPDSREAYKKYRAVAEMYIRDKRLLERWCGA